MGHADRTGVADELKSKHGVQLGKARAEQLHGLSRQLIDSFPRSMAL
jgi:hypothetical protein